MDAKKILIAEDERPMASALSLKLQNSGFQTTVAYTGAEAIALIKKESFDLILLDLVMPNTDGFEVLAYLQKQKNTTPVIVSSNLSQAEDIKRAKALGARDYFVKSDTSLVQVVEYVKKYL